MLVPAWAAAPSAVVGVFGEHQNVARLGLNDEGGDLGLRDTEHLHVGVVDAVADRCQPFGEVAAVRAGNQPQRARIRRQRLQVERDLDVGQNAGRAPAAVPGSVADVQVALGADQEIVGAQEPLGDSMYPIVADQTAQEGKALEERLDGLPFPAVEGRSSARLRHDLLRLALHRRGLVARQQPRQREEPEGVEEPLLVVGQHR